MQPDTALHHRSVILSVLSIIYQRLDSCFVALFVLAISTQKGSCKENSLFCHTPPYPRMPLLSSTLCTVHVQSLLSAAACIEHALH